MKRLFLIIILFLANNCSDIKRSQDSKTPTGQGLTISEEVSDISRVFYDDEPIRFGIVVNNTLESDRKLKISSIITNGSDSKKITIKDVEFELKANETRIIPLKHEPLAEGKYKLKVQVGEKDSVVADASFPFHSFATLKHPLKQIEVNQPGYAKVLAGGVDYTCQFCAKPPEIDGKLDEWKDINPILFEDLKGDFPAKAYIMWDTKYIYFAARVEYAKPPVNAEKILQGDHMALAIDPLGDSAASYNTDDHEIWFGKEGQVDQNPFLKGRHWQFEKLTLAKFAVNDADKNVRIYEGQIPWVYFPPVKPLLQESFGFKIIFGNKDGQTAVPKDSAEKLRAFSQLGFEQPPLDTWKKVETEQYYKIRESLNQLEQEILKLQGTSKDYRHLLASKNALFAALVHLQGDILTSNLKGVDSSKQKAMILDYIEKRVEELILDSKKEMGQLEPTPTDDVVIKDGFFYRGAKPLQMVGPFNTWGAVQRDLDQMRNFGLNAVHLNVHPIRAMVFREQGCYDLRPLEQLDDFLEKAKNNQLDVLLHFNIGVGKKFYNYPYPIKPVGCKGLWLEHCIEDPYHRKGQSAWIDIAVGRIAGHPTLRVYELGNEIHSYRCTCRYAVERFREWLKERYSTIEKLNKRWQGSIRSFDDISLNSIHKKENKAAYYDRRIFEQQRAIEFWKFLREAVRKKDPKTPVTLKFLPEPLAKATSFIEGFFYPNPEECPYLDYEGMLNELDITSYDASRDTLCIDFCKSVAPGKPFINAEMHNVATHDINDHSYDRMRRDLWQAALRGQQGTWIWTWGIEWFEHEAIRILAGGKPGLGGPQFAGLGQKPAELESFGRTALELQKFSEIAAAFTQLPTAVSIFYSNSSIIQDRKPHMTSLLKFYDATRYLDAKVGFTTERTISALSPAKTPLLILPSVHYIPDDAFNALEKYAKEGGTICLTEDSIRSDAYCNKLDESNWLNQASKNKKPLADDNEIFITSFGKGNIIWLSVPKVVQQIFNAMEKIYDQAKVARPIRLRDLSIKKGYQAMEGNDAVELRDCYLQGRDLVYVINNKNHNIDAAIETAKKSKAKDLVTGKETDLSKITLVPHAVMLLELVPVKD